MDKNILRVICCVSAILVLSGCNADFTKDTSKSAEANVEQNDNNVIPNVTENSSEGEIKPEDGVKPSDKLGQLKVASDKHMLSYKDGRDFFWMADTAWDMSKKFSAKENRNELIDKYMQNRREKGFNVIQTSAVNARYIFVNSAFNNDNNKSKEEGHPSLEFDKPRKVYWEMMDYIIESARKNDLYIALLPVWHTVLTSTSEAKEYGTFIAKRYKDKENIIWIVGGDSDASAKKTFDIWDTLGKTIKSIVGTKQLISYHPSGEKSSSDWFGDTTWLDFNMIQSGHCATLDGANKLLKDYRKKTSIPILDAEPRYEEIFKCLGVDKNETRISDDEVRVIAYRQLFSGAFGHTYGHHSIWQMYNVGDTSDIGGTAIDSWEDSLDDKGATYMGYLAKLMRSRPLLNRIPDQSLILGGNAMATRGTGYAFIYLQKGGSITVDITKISGTKVKAWWFNPRTGDATVIDTYEKNGTKVFSKQDTDDWVLVLDDTSKAYETPGQ